MRTARLRRRYGRFRGLCSGTVQSLLFERNFFTVDQAKAWARRHDRRFGDVDVKEDFIHLRQEDPARFKRYATIPFGRRGVSARVGWVC